MTNNCQADYVVNNTFVFQNRTASRVMASLVTKVHKVWPRLARAGTVGRCWSGAGAGVRSHSPRMLLYISPFQLQTTASMAQLSPARDRVQYSRNKQRKEYEESNIGAVLNRYFDKMDNDIKNNNRIMQYEVVNMLRLVKKQGECTYSQSLLMIRSCGEVLVDVDVTTRMRMLETTLDVLDTAGVKLDINHYNVLLKVSLQERKSSLY